MDFGGGPLLDLHSLATKMRRVGLARTEGETMLWNVDNLHPSHEFMRSCTAETRDFEHSDQFGNTHLVKVYWEGEDFVILLTPLVEGSCKGYKVVRHATETHIVQVRGGPAFRSQRVGNGVKWRQSSLGFLLCMA